MMVIQAKRIRSILPLIISLFVIVLATSVVTAIASTAYGQTEFSRIYNLKAKGEIKITGNTLMSPGQQRYGAANVESIMANPTAANNSYIMEPIDFDKSAETSSSSSAAITISPGASIEKAFLVWGGIYDCWSKWDKR